ncbi:FtsX-like permease family protein [Candidatus Pelagibacter sp.]|nr:FtsX-like permease family protein [Candidatus Pelagibacter sp.]
MINNLEKEIIFRFLKSRKKDSFLNLISIFSFIGITLGVAVLIIVMSVMNGFRTELINKIVGFNAHAIVKSYDKQLSIDIEITKNISNEIDNIILSNDGEAVIINKNSTKGVLLKGFLAEDFSKLNVLQNENFLGFKTLKENEISIGKDLSFNLNLDIGDKITIMSPVGVQTLVGSLPKQEIFNITSIYDSGLSDYNENVVYINLNSLEDLFDKNENQRFLEFYFKNPREIDSLKKKLSNIYDEEYVYTWADLNSSLFSALKVERNVMFIILSLIIIVAAFNIISGLTILVKNKTRDIGILKSIGVQNSSIKKIFFMIGFIIGTSATVFGVVIGVLFSIYIENIRNFISEIFNITLFPEEIYFLSKMPSEIDLQSIILISFCSIISTVIVSIFPASKAAKLDAVKTLKYE